MVSREAQSLIEHHLLTILAILEEEQSPEDKPIRELTQQLLQQISHERRSVPFSREAPRQLDGEGPGSPPGPGRRFHEVPR